MISALVYLQFHSIKNRTVARVKRLRQPKYLVGGIVGLLYFYFYFFRYLFRSTARPAGAGFAFSPEDLALFQGIGAVILLVVFVVGWVLPNSRAALTFTEAEIAFLFPAPISRRGLIHYRLMRSQVSVFFSVLVLTLITQRFGGKAWIHAAGWWLVLSTINLHMLGASFVRTLLLDRGISNWHRRLGVLLLVLLAGGAVVVFVRSQFGEVDPEMFQNPALLKQFASTVLETGPAYYLLTPMRWLVTPYLAPSAMAFFASLPGALLILGLHYVWVIKSNVAFEEASLEVSRRTADRIAAVRSGNWNSTGVRTKPSRAPFVLRSTGSPAVAIFWKNLIGAGKVFSPRTWIILLSVGVGTSVGLVSSPGMEGMPVVLGMISGVFLAWSVLLGPQVLRQDFRQDLAVADLLKIYPMSGWQMALGQLLAPAAILTAIQWLLLLIATISMAHVRRFGLSGAEVVSVAFSLALTLPVFNFISLLIPNASVLLFPAWFQTGKEAVQGIEATGQRLIAMLAQFLAFLLALTPAAFVFLVVFFVGRNFLVLTVLIPLATIPAGIVLAVEAGLGVFLLGKIFEKFNVSEEMSP